MRALSDIQAYNNPALLAYFCHHHPGYDAQNARQLLSDLLGWMWLSEERKQRQRQTWLFGPLLELDKLWHSFLLHTRDYDAFCQHYFGYYFHHDIEPIGQERQQDPAELEDFLQDCFEHLGEEWVTRRFAEAL